MSHAESRIEESDETTDPATVLQFTPMVKLQHLLRVAGSVGGDANKAWADVWAELKVCCMGSGCITPEAEKGFVPRCGWPDFLEKFWQIKFYLDCIQRVCNNEH